MKSSKLPTMEILALEYAGSINRLSWAECYFLASIFFKTKLDRLIRVNLIRLYTRRSRVWRWALGVVVRVVALSIKLVR